MVKTAGVGMPHNVGEAFVDGASDRPALDCRVNPRVSVKHSTSARTTENKLGLLYSLSISNRSPRRPAFAPAPYLGVEKFSCAT